MLWENKKLRSTKEKSEVTVNVDGVSLIQSSERTWSDGPSEREPAAITSQWRIGWQTPTLMLTCYILCRNTELYLWPSTDNTSCDDCRCTLSFLPLP